MLRTYKDLLETMEELKSKNLDPETKIVFGDGDLNGYDVESAVMVSMSEVLYDENNDGSNDQDSEKCIYFEIL